MILLERNDDMSKYLFINSSPNKDGNTYRIGEQLLVNLDHEVLQMSDYRISQYGQVYADDEMKEVMAKIDQVDTLVIGAPVYWYTVGGMLKTFIDRLYQLPEALVLKGKKLYLFAQGSAPDSATENQVQFLASRVAYLMGMDLKGVVVDHSLGSKILSQLTIES